MQNFSRCAGCLIMMTLAACVDTPTDLDMPAYSLQDGESSDSSAVIPGRYIVVFQPGLANVNGTARDLTRQYGGEIRHIYEHVLGGFAADLPDAAVQGIARNPNVVGIEPDRRYFNVTSSVQNNAPWHLDRLDQRGLPLTTTYEYWEDGSQVEVYVLDTGILRTHEEFGFRVSTPFFDAFGGTGDDCLTGLAAGHGTANASIVGGTTYGVAKAVDVYSVRTLTCDGHLDASNGVAAIDWVAQRQAAAPNIPMVANMSFAVNTSLGTQSLEEATIDLITAGVSVVAAAGNNKNPQDACNFSPGRLASVITVGATATTDSIASFSNIGSCVDVFAPGEGVEAATSTSNAATKIWDGTSQAAPQVAGAAALYLHLNPSATPGQVQGAITNHATSGAVRGVLNGAPNRLLYSPLFGVGMNGPSTMTLHSTNLWTASVSGGAAPFTYEWWRTDDSSPYLVSSTSSYTTTVRECEFSKLTLKVWDAAGRTAVVNRSIFVTDPKYGECPPALTGGSTTQ